MASKPAYALKSDALWQAYQTAQGSADHSARDCFNEVVGLEIAQRIKLLEDEIEAQVQHRLAVTRERDAALLKLEPGAMLLREIIAYFEVIESKYGGPIPVTDWPADWLRRARESLK